MSSIKLSQGFFRTMESFCSTRKSFTWHFTDLFGMRFFLAQVNSQESLSSSFERVCYFSLYTANWSPKVTFSSFPRRRAFIYFHPLHPNQSAKFYDQRSSIARTSWDDRFSYQPCVIGSRRSLSCFYNFPKFLDNFYTTTCCTFSTPTHWSSTSWQSRFDVLTERRAGKCYGFYNFFVNQSPLVSSLLLLHSPFHLHHKLNE